MNVNENDWKLELDHLLEIFEQESTTHLRKINQCFTALGRPFDEDFRQYYLEMSKLRLDSSFNKILFERWDESQVQTPSTATALSNDNEISDNLNLTVNNVGPLNVSETENEMETKTENKIDVTIACTDSVDDDVEEHSVTQEASDEIDDQQESNFAQDSAKINENSDSLVHDGIDLNVENDATLTDIQNQPSSSSNARKSTLNKQQKIDNRQKLMGLIRDPYDGLFKCTHYKYASRYKQALEKHQLIHDDAKPFRCQHCKYASRQKSTLKTHQRIHERQKLMDIKQDSNDGLYKCTHCDRRFTRWPSLGKHLTQSHKNNRRRIFNCGRRFVRNIEKERHEIQCQKRHYECYLCKTYITKKKTNMQKHMRTHTGSKPFHCAVCNKCFRQKISLNIHLDSIHRHIKK